MVVSPRSTKRLPGSASPGDVAEETIRISQETVQKIEEMIRNSEKSDQVEMYYDRDIDRVVVTISDGATQQVIRQIPSAEFVSFMKNFSQLSGLMFNRRL